MTAEPPIVPTWVIYDHPLDHPNDWVVRRWDAPDRPWPETTHRSLNGARAYVQMENPGAWCVGRSQGDDPSIYEVWL